MLLDILEVCSGGNSEPELRVVELSKKARTDVELVGRYFGSRNYKHI